MNTNKTGLSYYISCIYDKIISVVDNPFTISIAIVSLTVSFFLNYLWPIFAAWNVNNDDAQIILQSLDWLGTLYGFLAPLLLVHVQTQFGETQHFYDQESNTILTIYNTFHLFSNRQLGQLEQDIKTNLVSYIKHVTTYYSKEYYEKDKKNSGDEYLNNIRVIIGKLIKQGKNQVLTSELLRLTNDLLNLRNSRLTYTKQVATDILYILVIVASVYFLIPFYFLNFNNIFIKLIYIAGITFIVSLILQIVGDLSGLFGGVWRIELHGWEEALKKMH